jgi:hypothetical protein
MTKKTPLNSQLLAIELFVVWFMLTTVYFIFFTSIASALLGEKYGEVLAKLVGIAFGYIVSNGFFPLGFAKSFIKHYEKTTVKS